MFCGPELLLGQSLSQAPPPPLLLLLLLPPTTAAAAAADRRPEPSPLSQLCRLSAMPLCCGGHVCECSLPTHVQAWRDHQRQSRDQFIVWLCVVNARTPDNDPHSSCDCINSCNCPRTPVAKRRRLCDDPRLCFDTRCLCQL